TTNAPPETATERRLERAQRITILGIGGNSMAAGRGATVFSGGTTGESRSQRAVNSYFLPGISWESSEKTWHRAIRRLRADLPPRRMPLRRGLSCRKKLLYGFMLTSRKHSKHGFRHPIERRTLKHQENPDEPPDDAETCPANGVAGSEAPAGRRL